MERETGIEPATFSLGMWPSIENKKHSVHLDLVLAIENTGLLKVSFLRTRMEQKWSRRILGSEGNRRREERGRIRCLLLIPTTIGVVAAG
jgi:hypothetical protein